MMSEEQKKHNSADNQRVKDDNKSLKNLHKITWQSVVMAIGVVVIYSLLAVFLPGALWKISGIALATLVFSFLMYQKILLPVQQLQKELERTRKENQQLMEMRSTFVANVTHELKTPLTSISGFVETLQDGAGDNPEIRTKFLDIIYIETARLKRLINDILVLSAIESDSSTDEESIDVCATLKETIKILQPQSEEKNITLQSMMEPGLFLFGSKDRLQQLMMNIIENAIKYSPADSYVWITVKTEGGRVAFIVRDEGIGIAEENLGRIFERFYRVDKSRSSKAGSTGLGLSIVKHIAILFNATVDVQSKLGKGTTFTVRF